MPGKHGSQEFRWMAEVHRSVYVSVSVFTIVTPVLSGNAVSSKRFLFGLGMVYWDNIYLCLCSCCVFG